MSVNDPHAHSRKVARHLAVVNILVGAGGLLLIGGLAFIRLNQDADPVAFWAAYGDIGAATMTLIVMQVVLARRLNALTGANRSKSD
jgi:hypothetical protein